MIKDPVCGMEVVNGISVEYQGKTYHFCSEGCKEKFLKSTQEYTEKYLYDLIIIGGGPAGLTAGVYASIQHIDTLLIAEDIGGQAVDSTKIKNYMGFDFITGPELISKFQDQLIHRHYIDHKIDRVLRVNKIDTAYQVITQNVSKYRAKALIIATGMHRRTLNVPGEERLQRKGVCYRTLQDVPLFSGLDVAVVGTGNSGLQAASELSKIGHRVYLISQ